MTEWRDLQSWLEAPCQAGRVIAFRGGKARCEAALRQRIGQWRQALGTLAEGSVALSLADPFDFAAALLACWSSQRHVVLPADLLPATLNSLSGQVVAWIVDLPVPGAMLACAPAAESPEPASARALDLTRPLLALYTSGSTGAAQRIDKRLGQLAAELRALEQRFGAPGVARVLSGVSHQHIYGLLFGVLWPLCAGRPFVCERIDSPDSLPRLLSDGPNWLISTPAHLSRLNEALDWESARRATTRVFCSAAPLPETAADKVRTLLGEAACEVFGSSETGGVAWRLRAEGDAPWQPLPGVTWRLDGETLQLRSPFLDDPGSWTTTADRAAPCGDGFRLLGRADRIAKLEGRRVSLSAIERVLGAVQGIDAAHVFCLPSRLQRTAAVLELQADQPLPADAGQRRALIERCKSALADGVEPVAWPRRWRFVAPLSRDAQGKLTQRQLQALFEAELPMMQWVPDVKGGICARLRLDPALRVFRGHFPQAQVLPGVALIDWVARWAGDQFLLAGAFAGMEQIKFQRIVRPGSELAVRMACLGSGRCVQFEATSAAGVHASGRLLFGS